jgi:hypothetical protein
VPWSDWIVSTYTATPQHRRHLRPFDEDGDDDLIAEDLDFGAPNDIYAQIADSTDLNGQAVQFDAPSDWATRKSTLPDEIAFLEEGVDYAVKPGADPGDPFRWVDYDPDDVSVIVGWTFPDPSELIYRSDFAATGWLWLDPHTAYPSGFTPGGWPMVVRGTTFETLPSSAIVGDLFAAPPDPGSTDSFTVGIHTPTPWAGTPSVIAARIGNPFMTYTQPRWRYWIPGILPLRQFPRNDGLRGGAPSARPTSQQSTTARRTYL